MSRRNGPPPLSAYWYQEPSGALTGPYRTTWGDPNNFVPVGPDETVTLYRYSWGITTAGRSGLLTVEAPAILFANCVDIADNREHPFRTRSFWKDATDPAVWAYHGLCPAPDDPLNQVSFYQSWEHAARQRRTVMSVGRYIRRYWPELTDEQVHAEVAYWRTSLAPAVLHVSTDAADFRYVYVHGPDSCMSGKHDWEHLPCHPTEIYAAGDLAIGWITEDNDPEGKIVARCVLWPARNVHARIYARGSVARDKLIRALADAGYAEGSLAGARMSMVEYGGGYVMPYVDGDLGVAYSGGGFILSRQYDYYCQETCGHIAGASCENCGEPCDNTYSVDGQDWCTHCADMYAVACDDCMDLTETSGIVEVAGMSYCHHCADRNTTECPVCDERYPDDEMEEVSAGTGPDGREYRQNMCQGCAADYERGQEEGGPTPFLPCHANRRLDMLPPTVQVRIPRGHLSGTPRPRSLYVSVAEALESPFIDPTGVIGRSGSVAHFLPAPAIPHARLVATVPYGLPYTRQDDGTWHVDFDAYWQTPVWEWRRSVALTALVWEPFRPEPGYAWRTDISRRVPNLVSEALSRWDGASILLDGSVVRGNPAGAVLSCNGQGDWRPAN